MSTTMPRPPTSFNDVVKLLKRNIFSSLRCSVIGKIESFDGEKKTAKVKILFKRELPDGTAESYPALVDCPVLTLQGGGGAMEFPIAAGDHCLVVFADRSIDAWLKTGAESVPLGNRMHDISDGIAIVGLNALTSSLDNYKPSAARFFYGGAEIQLTGGLIAMKNATTDMVTLITALFTALESMQVVGNLALTPASIAALETVKAEFLTLFGAAV